MLKKQLVMIVFTLAAITSYAQVKISGSVYDEYLEPFYNAKISSGDNFAISDEEGNFTIVLSSNTLPQTLVVSAFGFKTEEVSVISFEKRVNVVLKENLLLDQVIISASRVPERIIESPVTVERLGLADIRKNTSNSFYDGLTNLKGINSREGSYGFKSINTRGFADFANTRFVQMIDGMDTAAQALSYSTGNFSGVSELDIQSVEILPGASSALYGANAYNGIMLMNTKNPFYHTGITTMFKSGYTSQEAGGNNPFYDVAVRMGYKFNDVFAAKVNFSYYEAEEWHANDLRNKEIDTNELIDGTINSTVNYNGVNTYGDELYYDLYTYSTESKPIPYGTYLRRTGYTEAELVRNNFKSKNARFSGSLYFRPFKDESLEIQLTSRLSLRDNLFQGTSRLAQRNYFIGQHKLEVKGNDFYVRGYYTGNNSGNSYDLARTGNALNDAAISVYDYANVIYDQIYNQEKSVEEARAYADRNRLIPGTNEFGKEFNKTTATLISDGGSKVYEKSSYTHLDGNYNFKRLLNDWADLQVGASYREYNPNSKGTLFNDKEEKVSIKEYGVYTQIQKKFFEERLKLTGSIRYDESDNFEGNFSPRLAVNYALGEEKNHVLRASYQTGFRNPSIQEQYMFFDAELKTNVGAIGDNLSRISYPDSYYKRWDEQQNQYVDDIRTVEGKELLNNALLTKTVFSETPTFLKSDYKELVPEVVKTIELGYRSMFRLNNETNVDVDINAFYSKHDNFVFTQDIFVPNGGKVYPYGKRKATEAELEEPQNKYGYIVDGVVVLDDEAVQTIFSEYGALGREFNIMTNAKSQVESYGFGFGMHTKLFSSFDFGLNYNFIDFKYEDKDYGLFEPNFNTPKHTVKAQFGNENLFNNFGFGVSARWQDKYRWVSNFVKGDVAERTVIDAQLNYRIPSIKSRIKVGGTNLFGKEYYVAPGSGKIGQLYYISWIINN